MKKIFLIFAFIGFIVSVNGQTITHGINATYLGNHAVGYFVARVDSFSGSGTRISKFATPTWISSIFWAKTDTGAYKKLASYYDLHKNYAPLASPTFTGIPTFNTAGGVIVQDSINAQDTIGFAVSGLTTGAKAIVTYTSYIASPDTLPFVFSYKTGWLTLCGKYKKSMTYFIFKK